MPAPELWLLHAEEVFRELVPGHQPLLLIDHHDRHGGVLEDRAVPQFRRLQLAFRLLPLHGIADGPHQQTGVHLPLDQVILHAHLHRLRGGVLIIQSAEHDDRHVRRVGLKAAHRLHALTVRQAQIQQHDVEGFFRSRSSAAESRSAWLHVAAPQRRLADQSLEKLPIDDVVFDDQQSQRSGHGQGHPPHILASFALP